MLFENRQPKITYFLFVQSPFSLNSSIKSNVDSAWVFGGYAASEINFLFYQLNIPIDKQTLMQKYSQLTPNQALIFDYRNDGTRMGLLLQ